MKNALRRIQPKPFKNLVLAMLCAMGAWGFIEVADEVAEDDTKQFDEAILLSLREADDTSDPIGPIWFEEAARDITALGSLAILLLASVGTLVFLMLIGKRRTSLLFLLCALSGVALSQGLKGLYDRARPDLVPHEMHVLTASFPSGHSLLSAVIYLSLGAMLANSQPRLLVKSFLIGTSIALAILVGLSRLYLGVHWPSDVLAGWSAGAAWAILWVIIARLFLPRQETESSGLEQPAPPSPAQTSRNA
ncbi:phosphatase PAP2 family protein [Pelagicoccus sp. SDUM812003]|uniref:phosphatase PAP2 family protein n=1 Tax=Pelagicoccus sp. SDUM812003 TaxID=3041267 RepID=UPI00280DD689|nr:phosphatase PAP2 family protein [Pelagicoccus sp. SDUM812003]MDQ8203397.1 phosphatase PAP2 family protein [Pelagicoccus sp. SDUM812003]